MGNWRAGYLSYLFYFLWMSIIHSFSLEIDEATFSYYIDGETVPSIQFVTYMVAGVGFNDQTAPWGTKWIGKGAKSGGWYNNL